MTTLLADFEKRRQTLKRRLRQESCRSLLVTNFKNVTYLTGFTGDDSYLVVTGDDCWLLSDPRYEEQLRAECPDLKVYLRSPATPLADALIEVLRKAKLSALLIEGDSMTAGAFARISEELPSLTLGISRGVVEALRAIKDAVELDHLRRAIVIAERAFLIVRAQLREGQTELELANELDRQIRLLGGSGCSFDPIVAVGARAALPHGRASLERVGSAPFVLIDWGAVLKLYRSDLTRVLVTGKMTAKFAKVYETVLAAQHAAIEALRPGVRVSEVDRIAHEVVDKAGMGKRFNHGLGHGIGLDIHEAPRLAKKPDVQLQAGMVVTVEPGIYFPGWGGVRIEDDVLITRGGHEVMSNLPRGLAENQVELLT